MNYSGNPQFNHTQSTKTAVLLVNLGTPEHATPASLRRYLKEFLSDPRVVEVPRLLWWFILRLFILPFRAKRSAQAYASIWQQGSPLFINSVKLADKVQQQLSAQGSDITVSLAMRYGQPSVASQIDKLLAAGVNKLLVLPLYPQYSATTTASVFDAVSSHLQKVRAIPEVRFINHYHDHPLYIDAIVNSIKQQQQTSTADKLILSYHGIPNRYWLQGDHYICECFKTSRLVAEQLPESNIETCFQSRFGKEPWVEPYLDKRLEQLGKDGVESVQVICPGFAVDCLETLEEIAEENQEVFLHNGGKQFDYIECLNDSDDHSKLLLSLINQHTQGWTDAEINATAYEQVVKQRA